MTEKQREDAVMLMFNAVAEEANKRADRFAATCTRTTKRDRKTSLQSMCTKWKKGKSLLLSRQEMEEFDWGNAPECLLPLWNK